MSDPCHLRGRKVAHACFPISFVFLLVSRSFAQVDSGSILGTVRDSSNAIVRNAAVTLTNEGTGQTETVQSGLNGEYVFSPVRIGHYTLTAELEHFQKVEHPHISVDVQQHVLEDLVLTPGQSTETISVNDQPDALQTQDASVGQVIGTKTVNDLPLNGRNFTFLAQLSAGVTQGQQDGRGLSASGSFAANGSRPSQNNYLLDGIDNNSNLPDF